MKTADAINCIAAAVSVTGAIVSSAVLVAELRRLAREEARRARLVAQGKVWAVEEPEPRWP